MSTLSYYAKLFVIRKVTIHKGNELLVWARFYGQLRRVRCALSFRTYLEKLSYIKLRYYIFQLLFERCFCNDNPICPPEGAKIRKFEIAAIQTDIEYNRYGDHDPEGMLFVPLENAEDVRCGRKKPIPLILRANAGDWIEITLHNLFDKPVLYHDYPSVPLDMYHEPSDRVSLSPQFLKHCPVYSAGVNVGFNKPEQTAAPGERIKYLWHADKEYGTCMLSSFGDLRNHRYHGLFGAIIIEPPAAQYYCKCSFQKENFNEQAVITALGVKAFREFVLHCCLST